MPIWAAWLCAGGVFVVMAAIGGWWIWAKLKKNHIFISHGMRVFDAYWDRNKCQSDMPLPDKEQTDAYVASKLAKAAIEISLLTGRDSPDMSLQGCRLMWMSSTRFSKVDGELVQDPKGSRYSFEDRTARTANPTHKHRWFAGIRKWNTFRVAWADNINRTALGHEIGHHLLEKNGLDSDGSHTLYKSFWKAMDSQN